MQLARTLDGACCPLPSLQCEQERCPIATMQPLQSPPALMSFVHHPVHSLVVIYRKDTWVRGNDFTAGGAGGCLAALLVRPRREVQLFGRGSGAGFGTQIAQG